MIAGMFPGDGCDCDETAEFMRALGIDTVLSAGGEDGGDDGRLDEQLRIYRVSTLLWDRFRSERAFAFVAGHSLGFYAALYASGVIDRQEGEEIIRIARRAIEEVGGGLDGGMTAIIGLKWFIIDDICRRFSSVHVANINSATQVVVSGRLEELEEVERAALAGGALNVKRLNADAPLHSPLMEGVGDIIGEGIRGMSFSEPCLPLVDHTAPGVFEGAERIRDVLMNQLTRRVLWRDAVVFMYERGVREFAEIGPSDVLARLVRWIVREASARTSVEMMEGTGNVQA